MLTVRDVAQELTVSATCVYQLIASGKLPSHRIGVGRGAIRVSECDLAEFLVSCRHVEQIKSDATRRARNSGKFKHLTLDE